MGNTLAAIRQNWLNDELGVVDDNDLSYGSTTIRNNFLRRAFGKLWPQMARLVRLNVTVQTAVTDYSLGTVTTAGVIRDIVRIEVLGTDGVVRNKLKSWAVSTDETTEPATSRMRLEAALLPSVAPTLRVVGYARYKIPTDGTDTCDLPLDLEYVVSAGARVEAYRWKLGAFVNYEGLANSNRANAMTSAEISALLNQATAEFERYKRDNQRDVSAGRRTLRGG